MPHGTHGTVGCEVVAPLPVPERDEATLMSRSGRMTWDHHSVTVLFRICYAVCDTFGWQEKRRCSLS